jgi:hypothetical protein
MESKSCGVLDTPLSRSMTIFARQRIAQSHTSRAVLNANDEKWSRANKLRVIGGSARSIASQVVLKRSTPSDHVCLVFDVSFAFDIESGSAQRWRLGAPELKPS